MSKYYPPAPICYPTNDSLPSTSSEKETKMLTPQAESLLKNASFAPTTHTRLDGFQSCDLVRFVLRSGASLELTSSSIEEIVESVAGRVCHAVCGCNLEGKRISFDWQNVDYIMES